MTIYLVYTVDRHRSNDTVSPGTCCHCEESGKNKGSNSKYGTGYTELHGKPYQSLYDMSALEYIALNADDQP